VSEYWVADPEVDAVSVFRLIDGRYERAALLELSQGDALRTPLLAGLVMPLAAIFED
jgi:Uma2 family endonuclease